MCFTICGRYVPYKGGVAGYGNRIWGRYTAKWGIQIAGMGFQTPSGVTTVYKKGEIPMGGNYAKGVYDQLMDVMARLDTMCLSARKAPKTPVEKRTSPAGIY